MTGASGGTVSEAGTGTASTTPVATLAAYERSGHTRARRPVFPHELQTISPLHSARVCPTCKQRLHRLFGHNLASCPSSPHLQKVRGWPGYAMWALCPLAHKVEGISDLSSILTRLVPLDTLTFKEFRLLVAGHLPKTPQCPHNNLSRHVQREVEDCNPHRTVIRCDLQSPNSLQSGSVVLVVWFSCPGSFLGDFLKSTPSNTWTPRTRAAPR
ncbi:hypothetical protein BSL78_28126 [Apostichopus japonicus]|uniref:Uncharacterized protein n=1 Tax=Stichopus japonicus TaxID=307972 RepID=A0A2G8JH18_STIJA|nr:hypothetical protein BSL78_28126 [Apostichopus japonicus]